MSAALTHLASGMLLGMALGIRPRHLPLVGLLAMAPDIDHLFMVLGQQSPIWLRPRVTFHNLVFVAVVPAAFALIATRARASRDMWRLIYAAPAAFATHLLLDLAPLDGGKPGWVALFYPFSDMKIRLPFGLGDPLVVTSISNLTFVLAGMVSLVAIAQVAWSLQLRIWVGTAVPTKGTIAIARFWASRSRDR